MSNEALDDCAATGYQSCPTHGDKPATVEAFLFDGSIEMVEHVYEVADRNDSPATSTLIAEPSPLRPRYRVEVAVGPADLVIEPGMWVTVDEADQIHAWTSAPTFDPASAVRPQVTP